MPWAMVQTAEGDYTSNVLISGANRGLGFAFVRHYARAGWRVLATCRDPERAEDFQALAATISNVVVEQLDVTDHARIDALAAHYHDQPIDVLINNAGTLGDIDKQVLGEFDFDLFNEVMAVNAFGALKMSAAFSGHVALSRERKIISMASGMGSMTLTEDMAGFYYYRMSKAALNMAMRAVRTDLRPRGVIVAMISAGTVDTDMQRESGHRGSAMTPDESVATMAEIIAGLSISDPGVVIDVGGRSFPW